MFCRHYTKIMKFKAKDKCTPERWERYLKYRRDLRMRNKDKERERDRIRKAKKRLENKEGINEYQRSNYRKSADAAKKQCERRHKREPSRAIRNVTGLFTAGSLTFVEAIERVDDIIAESNAKDVSKRRSGNTAAE